MSTQSPNQKCCSIIHNVTVSVCCEVGYLYHTTTAATDWEKTEKWQIAKDTLTSYIELGKCIYVYAIYFRVIVEGSFSLCSLLYAECQKSIIWNVLMQEQHITQFSGTKRQNGKWDSLLSRFCLCAIITRRSSLQINSWQEIEVWVVTFSARLIPILNPINDSAAKAYRYILAGVLPSNNSVKSACWHAWKGKHKRHYYYSVFPAFTYSIPS